MVDSIRSDAFTFARPSEPSEMSKMSTGSAAAKLSQWFISFRIDGVFRRKHPISQTHKVTGQLYWFKNIFIKVL